MDAHAVEKKKSFLKNIIKVTKISTIPFWAELSKAIISFEKMSYM